MKVEITALENTPSVNQEALERFAHIVMDKVQQLDQTFSWSHLSIVLSDDRIRDLNHQWFDKDTVTDVISFAYPAGPGEEGDSGEVILNLQQALEEGQLRDSPDNELALYLAHGCHHLMGATDDTPERKDSMLSLEIQWVSDATRDGHCGPFFL